jgi:hypothetical protein
MTATVHGRRTANQRHMQGTPMAGLPPAGTPGARAAATTQLCTPDALKQMQLHRWLRRLYHQRRLSGDDLLGNVQTMPRYRQQQMHARVLHVTTGQYDLSCRCSAAPAAVQSKHRPLIPPTRCLVRCANPCTGDGTCTNGACSRCRSRHGDGDLPTATPGEPLAAATFSPTRADRRADRNCQCDGDRRVQADTATLTPTDTPIRTPAGTATATITATPPASRQHRTATSRRPRVQSAPTLARTSTVTRTVPPAATNTVATFTARRQRRRRDRRDHVVGSTSGDLGDRHIRHHPPNHGASGRYGERHRLRSENAYRCRSSGNPQCAVNAIHKGATAFSFAGGLHAGDHLRQHRCRGVGV